MEEKYMFHKENLVLMASAVVISLTHAELSVLLWQWWQMVIF